MGHTLREVVRHANGEAESLGLALGPEEASVVEGHVLRQVVRRHFLRERRDNLLAKHVLNELNT